MYHKRTKSPARPFRAATVRKRDYPVVIAILLGLPVTATAVLIDRIAVIAADRAIKDSDIQREIRVVSFLNKEKPDLSATGRKGAAQRLIDQTLIRRDIELARYSVADPKEVDHLYQQVGGRYGSPQAFQSALRQAGITDDELRRALTWQVTVLRFIEQRFRPTTTVSEQEARNYYQQHRASFQNATFAQARPRIEDVLRGNEINEAFEAWLEQTRSNTRIRYLEEELR
jgi:hypothetical protein